MAKKMKTLDIIAIVLLIIGGLNWGLVGIFNINLVQLLVGVGFLAKVIYALVGASAIYSIYSFIKK